MGWFGERERERGLSKKIKKKEKSNGGLAVLGFILFLRTKLVTFEIF